MSDEGLNRVAALAKRRQMLYEQEAKERKAAGEASRRAILDARKVHEYFIVADGDFWFNAVQLKKWLAGMDTEKVELPSRTFGEEKDFAGYACFSATDVIRALNRGAAGTAVMGALAFFHVRTLADLDGYIGSALGRPTVNQLRSGYIFTQTESSIEAVFSRDSDAERHLSRSLTAWTREGGKGKGPMFGRLEDCVPFNVLALYRSPDQTHPLIVGVLHMVEPQATTPAPEPDGPEAA